MSLFGIILDKRVEKNPCGIGESVRLLEASLFESTLWRQTGHIVLRKNHLRIASGLKK
jgi:hypothetical protein